MNAPRKSLGQHWLTDESVLSGIADAAEISKNDTILEVGPGPGTLTGYLAKRAKNVVAVELDRSLAHRLANNPPGPNLEVINGDILKFNFAKLPQGYKLVANIPYYITGKLLAVICETENPPKTAVLLVQNEVAERINAGPGQMSIIAVAVQLHFEPKMGEAVPARLFEPPPKVDSRVLILSWRSKPLFDGLDSRLFFRVVKAGFSEKRKKLRSSLAGGLGLDKRQTDRLLSLAEINGDLRAQNLSLEQWHQLYVHYRASTDLKNLATLPRSKNA